MRLVCAIATIFLLACACAGEEPAAEPAPSEPPPSDPPPAPPTDPAWIDQAVQEALDWEVMPGTTGEEDDGTRAAALRTFFTSHPEYAAPERRALLAANACGLDGTEAAHEYLVKPPPKEPLVVDVTDAAWKVFVAHADHHCTSDDWSWYSSESSTAASERGATTAYGTPTNDVLVVRLAGAEVARVPLTDQGFLVVKAGAPAQELGYAPTPEITPGMDAYFAGL